MKCNLWDDHQYDGLNFESCHKRERLAQLYEVANTSEEWSELENFAGQCTTCAQDLKKKCQEYEALQRIIPEPMINAEDLSSLQQELFNTVDTVAKMNNLKLSREKELPALFQKLSQLFNN